MDFEALWTFQTEDLKAEAIATEIKRSPTRMKLEKARDFIMDRQKLYKQIEDSISAISDRKDFLFKALEGAIAEIENQKERMTDLDPEDEEAVATLRADVARARDEIRSFEKELNQMNVDSVNYDRQLRSVRVEAARAKQNFDQLKADYENESRVKKEELEQQRARVKALEGSVDPDLMKEYLAIRKHTTPPVVRLQYGQCSGCNTSLPSATLSKIKSGALVECETCGRMIIQ